jgi:hypothetical protein
MRFIMPVSVKTYPPEKMFRKKPSRRALSSVSAVSSQQSARQRTPVWTPEEIPEAEAQFGKKIVRLALKYGWRDGEGRLAFEMDDFEAFTMESCQDDEE